MKHKNIERVKRMYQCIYDDSGTLAWNNYKICDSKQQAIMEFLASMPNGWKIKYIFEIGKNIYE